MVKSKGPTGLNEMLVSCVEGLNEMHVSCVERTQVCVERDLFSLVCLLH